jgi:histidinol-phosphatase
MTASVPVSDERPDITADLTLALGLADIADRITMARANAVDLRVERKPDRSPVTDADLAV